MKKAPFVTDPKESEKAIRQLTVMRTYDQAFFFYCPRHKGVHEFNLQTPHACKEALLNRKSATTDQ